MSSSISEKLAYTIPEAAEALTCSVPHVWRLIAKGKLRKTKIGRRTIVPASALRAFVEGMQDSLAPAPTASARDDLPALLSDLGAFLSGFDGCEFNGEAVESLQARIAAQAGER